MKKFLIVFGAISFAIIVLGGARIALVAMRGNALDQESKAYAEAAIPAIITDWNKKELLDRAGPEFRKSVSQQQLDQLFHWSARLGQLRKFEPTRGQAIMAVNSQNAATTTADCATQATFENGVANVTLSLIEHDAQWQILGFKIFSPQPLPQ